MSEKGQTLPASVYEELLALMLEQFGDGWASDATHNRQFGTSLTSVIQTSEGMHLIGTPEIEKNSVNFNLWVEHPVEDVWEADELAFAVFAQVAEDIFLSSRQIEERGVRYRFVTGSIESGYIGSLHFTGPHAKELADVYRMRITQGHHYHA
jgi:hypothetical protein